MFANDELDENKLNVYKKQLSKGGTEAITAAEALKALFVSSPNTTTTQGKSIQGDRSMSKQELVKPTNYISQEDAAYEFNTARTSDNIVKQQEIKEARLASMAYEEIVYAIIKEQEVKDYAQSKGVNL